MFFKTLESVGQTKILALLFFILFIVCGVYSEIIYVGSDDPNDPGSGTFSDPFGRIQDAIDKALKGDVIEIRPGVYTGAGNYNLDPEGKSISIRSNNPEDVDIVSTTIIDPNGAGRGFYLHSAEDANCIIAGLTIRNAYTGGKGGGIYCYESHPTIANCILLENRAGTHGGGLFCQDSFPRITGCVICGNISANEGGGIEWWHGSAELKQCIIYNNKASGIGGGGADFFNCDNVAIINCTFAANTANSGGGLHCWSSNCAVTNSVFRGNSAETSGAEISIYGGNVTVSYSDIEGGPEGVSNTLGSLTWAEGNIDIDPDFVSFESTGDPTEWDFRLQSQFGRWDKNTSLWVEDGVTSECIDAGDPNSDYGGEPWPNGGRVNMGAYGNTNQASKNGNIADFDISGSVDVEDLMELVSKWLAGDSSIINLDMAGVVDIADFAVFGENWLWQKE